MPKSAPIQSNFTAGELSPLAQGRIDLIQYKHGLNTCYNYVPTIQGSLTRRPGTKYLGAAKYGGLNTRLVPFELAIDHAYVIEVGNTYFRFWRNDAVLGGPYEVTTPYGQADVFNLRFIQAGTVMYILHPSYPIGKLTWSGDTSWSLTTFTSFTDGPYLDYNATGTTLNFDPNTGSSQTVTASSTTGINGGAGFQAADVGRLIQWKMPITLSPATGYTLTQDVANNYGGQLSANGNTGSFILYVRVYGVITARTNTTTIAVTLLQHTSIFALAPTGVNVTNPSAGNWSTWALGVFYQGNGPSCGTIHEGRLWLSGVPSGPRQVFASVSLKYDTFSPDDSNGNVLASSGLNFTLNSADAAQTQWLVPDEKGLLLGTNGDEWTVRPSLLSEAMSPTNIDAKTSSRYGSTAVVEPLRIGKSVLFSQRCNMKVREMSFAFEVNGYRAPERTKLAEHITKQVGIKQMVLQREPHAIVWCLLNDGTLAAMTHEEEDGAIVTGWHRHAFEAMLPAGVEGSPPTPPTIQSIAVIPSGDGTRDELWMVVKRIIKGQVQYYIETMQKFFTQYDNPLTAWNVDCGLEVFLIGGTTFTVSHLKGEWITVLGDGAPMGDFLVDADTGSVTLPYAVTTVIAGYRYKSQGQILRLDSGAADGTAIGKIRRAHRVGLYLRDMAELSIGESFDKLTALNFRDTSVSGSTAVPLYNGIRLETIDADYDFDNLLCWQQYDPLPGTVLAIMPRLDTQDAE